LSVNLKEETIIKLEESTRKMLEESILNPLIKILTERQIIEDQYFPVKKFAEKIKESASNVRRMKATGILTWTTQKQDGTGKTLINYSAYHRMLKENERRGIPNTNQLKKQFNKH